MITKKCVDCLQEKPLTEFHKNKTRSDGYRYDCKICAIKKTKKYNKEHKNEKLEYQRQYIKKDYVKRKAKNYRDKNKEIIRKKARSESSHKRINNWHKNKMKNDPLYKN